jgi:predicted ATPase
MDMALATVEETDECLWEAELYRMRAELQLMNRDERKAQRCLQKAIEVARQQSAKSWELRATTSLARLWKKQGRTHEAQQILSPIYDWFSEGFDTPDLNEASTLLVEIA